MQKQRKPRSNRASSKSASRTASGVRTTSKRNSIKDEVVALKKERIIEAAAQMMYDRGYENTTLESVAEHLGVTKPFIYSYFTSKSELLAEICSRGIVASLDAINRVVADDSASTSRERVSTLARDFVVAVLKNQKNIAIFTREEKNLQDRDYERISNLRREFDKKLTSLLDDGVAAGEFAELDTRVAALAIGGLVSWAYVWYRPHGRLELERLADELGRLILAMIEARNGRRAGR